MTIPHPCPEGIRGHPGNDVEPRLWRVHWWNSYTEQDGYDDVTAPTSHHAVWEVASGFLEYIVATMEFRSVEEIGATEDGIPLALRPRGSVTGMGD